MWKALFSSSAGSKSGLAVFYRVASVLKSRSMGLDQGNIQHTQWNKANSKVTASKIWRGSKSSEERLCALIAACDWDTSTVLPEGQDVAPLLKSPSSLTVYCGSNKDLNSGEPKPKVASGSSVPKPPALCRLVMGLATCTEASHSLWRKGARVPGRSCASPSLLLQHCWS